MKATKQSLVRKRLKIASLSLAMTITYADTLMKRYTRNPNEMPNHVEIGWIQSLWYKHQLRVMIITAQAIARCLSKMRSQKRYDYTDDYLSKTIWSRYQATYSNVVKVFD